MQASIASDAHMLNTFSQKVMRALGLGVVIETGPGSKLSVGDYVSGPWGECSIIRLDQE